MHSGRTHAFLKFYMIISQREFSILSRPSVWLTIGFYLAAADYSLGYRVSSCLRCLLEQLRERVGVLGLGDERFRESSRTRRILKRHEGSLVREVFHALADNEGKDSYWTAQLRNVARKVLLLHTNVETPAWHQREGAFVVTLSSGVA